MKKSRFLPTTMACNKGPPIDRGWAWVVMIAVHMCFIFSVGYLRTFGILFVEFLTLFKASSSVTALIMGIHGAVFSITGFLAQNVLSTFISTRTIVMFGGFLIGTGIILSYFARTISVLILTQSILVGCGNAFVIGPGLVLLGQYFNKHRSLAMAVANTGGNVGAVLMPPLIRYLVDEYNVMGTFIIIGAMVLNIIACGALLRPTEVYKTSKAIHEDQIENMKTERGTSKNGLAETSIVHPEVKSLLSENCENDVDAPTFDPIHRSSSHRTLLKRVDSYSKYVTVKYASTPDLACLSIQDIPASFQIKKQSTCLAFLDRTLDFSLFRKATFYLIMAVAGFGVLGEPVMGMYVPALAAEKGVSKNEVAIILSVNGAVGGVSRVFVGYFADKNIMKRSHILALALIITGVTGLLAPVYNTFWHMMVFGVVFGFSAALYFTLIPVIVVDFLGIDKLAKTHGFLQLIHGASIAAIHPISGLLRDITGNFDASYLFFGFTCMVGSILLLLEPCARRFDEKRSNPKAEMEMGCGSSDDE